MTQTGIRIDGVTKAYKNGPRAVDDVDLEIRDGEFMVLVGPSGCGKSTLLKLIAGIEETTAGTIHIGDRDVTHLDPRKRDIAMVFQSYALYPHLTVRATSASGSSCARPSKAEIAKRVDEVARILGLDEMLDRKPGELSGGQRQRVAMGRAIVREPQAFLMDEPLSNLDAKLRVSMRAQLSRLHERLGVTTVYVTHDQVEAMTLGERVAVLRGGVLQQCDTPEVLFEHPANLFVAAFIGSPAMNLVEATVEDGEARFGACRVPLAPGSPLRGRHHPRHPPARPQAREPSRASLPAACRSSSSSGPRRTWSWGSTRRGCAPSALRDAIDAAPDDDVLLADDDRATFTVVTEARTPVAVGDTVELGARPGAAARVRRRDRRGARERCHSRLAGPRIVRQPTQLTFAPSPGSSGELSRRLPSELVVHSFPRTSTGLVGNSSGPALRSRARPTRVAEVLDRAALVGDDRDRVALVDRDEDVLVVVEHDPVGALEVRVLDHDRVQAQRVGRERRVAAGPAQDAAVAVEVHAPDRAARGVGDVQRPVVVERDAVGHQVLGAERVRRLTAGLGDRDRPGRQPAHVAADRPGASLAIGWTRKTSCGTPSRPIRHTRPWRGPAVGDPEVAAAVEGDAVGARHARRRRPSRSAARRRSAAAP